MNPTLILQAQQRKAQIKNNGTVEQLREVLKKCWPKDPMVCNGDYMFYLAGKDDYSMWVGCDVAYIDLSILNVTDFYQPSFTWGQEVMWRNTHPHIFVAINPVLVNQAIIVNEYGTMANCDLLSLSPIPSRITPEQAAGEMVVLLKECFDTITTTTVHEKIKSLLNRIK